MKTRFSQLPACCALIMIAFASHGAEPKRLIEFGWDEPDPTFMRQHIAAMEQTPFDGCVFHIDYVKPDGAKGSFTWQGWGTNAFSESDLQIALADLRAIQSDRFKHNFLRFNTSPAKLDWFDDYSAITNNARIAARIAYLGKCPGLLFDIEQYEGQLFDYHQQRDAKEKSWELYAAQARRRGREVMGAFQTGYPDLTIFLTFGYCLPWQESREGRRALAECHYGLLAPFLDGMIEAANGRSRFVDGCELSYGYRDTSRFATAYQTMRDKLLPIVNNPHKYRQVFSFGFGIWLDEDWRKLGWNVEQPDKNYYSPDAFEHSVSEALRVADDYIWIYSETPRWWTANGQSDKLPASYAAALERAKAANSMTATPGLPERHE